VRRKKNDLSEIQGYMSVYSRSVVAEKKQENKFSMKITM